MVILTKHKIASWYNSRPSRKWGAVYLGAIPVFALIYWFMPADWFGGKPLSGLFDALYFSIITITTLGFGEIFPTHIWAKAAVVAESLFGIIAIGLFLNEVAHYRAKLSAQVEKNKAEKARISNEEIRLRRQYVVIEPHLNQYIEYATIISTPIGKRKGVYHYNPDFPFQDLYDIYSPSLRLKDNHLEPVIVHYYRKLHELESRLETALQAVDFSIWPEIENKILTVLNAFRKYDFESSILGNIHMTLGNRKVTEVDSELIKTWSGTIDFHQSNVINQYIALYLMIKETMPPLLSLEEHIHEIADHQ